MRLLQTARQLLSGEPTRGAFWLAKADGVPARAPAVDRRDARPENRYRGQLRAELVTFEKLRQLANSCDAVANAIQVRIDQIRATPLKFQPKEGVEESQQDEATSQAVAAEEFFGTSGGFGGPGMSMQDALCTIIEDLLTIGATCQYRRKTRGGDTYSVEFVDAATIKPLLTDGGWTPIPPEPAYEQYNAQGLPNGRTFTADEMRYTRFRARSNSRWGRSPTENVLSAVLQYIATDAYNLSWFVDGDGEWSYWQVPNDWTAQQIAQFDAYVEAVNKARASSPAGATRSLPAGPERKSSRPRADAAFEKTQVHLVRRVARAFSLSASVLGFEGAQYKVSAEEQNKSAELWGENVLKLLIKGMLDDILREDLQLGLVEAMWQDEEEDLTPVAGVIAQVGTERVAPNKARELLGLPPAEGPLVNALYTVLGSGQVVIIGWEPGSEPPEVLEPPAPKVVTASLQQDADATPDEGRANAPPDLTQAAKSDLSRWQRKALKYLVEGHLEKCDFTSTDIPPPIMGQVRDALSKSSDAADVRAAFAFVRSPEQTVDVAQLAGDLDSLLSAVRCERGKREGF